MLNMPKTLQSDDCSYVIDRTLVEKFSVIWSIRWLNFQLNPTKGLA